MLANRRGEVLTFDKVHVLAAGISEDIAEGVDTPFSLGSKIDVVGGIIHLRLDAGSGFKTANQFPRVAAQLAQMIADNGVGAFKSKPAQFFSHPNGGDLGIAFQKLNDIVLEGSNRLFRGLRSLGGAPVRSSSCSAMILATVLRSTPSVFAIRRCEARL